MKNQTSDSDGGYDARQPVQEDMWVCAEFIVNGSNKQLSLWIDGEARIEDGAAQNAIPPQVRPADFCWSLDSHNAPVYASSTRLVAEGVVR